MNFIPLYLPIAKMSWVVYNENNKGPMTEPWGTPSRSLQRSERVEAILIALRHIASTFQNRTTNSKIRLKATKKSGMINPAKMSSNIKAVGCLSTRIDELHFYGELCQWSHLFCMQTDTDCLSYRHRLSIAIFKNKCAFPLDFQHNKKQISVPCKITMLFCLNYPDHDKNCIDTEMDCGFSWVSQ